jgi:hydrogenase nickel incorporation protein HypB
VAKYPEIFSLADAVVLNKLDLREHLRFDLSLFRRSLRDLNPDAPLIEVSCSTGEGLDQWMEWLSG